MLRTCQKHLGLLSSTRPPLCCAQRDAKLARDAEKKVVANQASMGGMADLIGILGKSGDALLGSVAKSMPSTTVTAPAAK